MKWLIWLLTLSPIPLFIGGVLFVNSYECTTFECEIWKDKIIVLGRMVIDIIEALAG